MKEYLENDNYVLCPICGKEKFYPEDYFIFCNHCGWEGNMNIDDSTVELNGFSAKDYKKVYQEYLKEHPNYIWKYDKEALNNYMDSFIDYGSKCPCCSENSFDSNHNYCYKCGWKYNFVQAQYPDYDDSSNKLSLNKYKEEFNDNIKNNPSYMWKNTDKAKIPFNDKQIEWLINNNIEDFNKLTPEEEIHIIFNKIQQIQRQYENKDNYEEYMFIKSILDTILDNI